MRSALVAILALAAAGAATAGEPPAGRRIAMGELFVYRDVMDQALMPLMPLPERVVREGLCPGLTPAPDGRLYQYKTEVRFVPLSRREETWRVAELRLANPSGCAAMDDVVKTVLTEAVPRFVEPRRTPAADQWIALPAIALRIIE